MPKTPTQAQPITEPAEVAEAMDALSFIFFLMGSVGVEMGEGAKITVSSPTPRPATKKERKR